jgi:DNA helicase-2/ATP-dependent DNA helicase PcrA
MTTTQSRAQGVRIDSPADLRRVMRADFEVSAEQWAAVSAPLEPAVVIAGAGSGKTSLMAARVVYLVATGQVRPEEVLGLTFTTKAAAELRSRVRSALDAAGHGPAGRNDADDPLEQSEPTVATYNAYAARLLTEHGLRIGHEPDVRVLADASRYQLAARAIARHREQVLLLTDSPKHLIDDLLALEGAMSEHLVGLDEVRAFTSRARELFAAELATKQTKVQKALVDAQDKRLELLGLVQTYRGLKAELGLMDFSDQIALAARLAEEQPEVGALERETFRVVLLDEYQDTSVAQARLLRRLFSGETVDTGRGHPVMAVGDPNQAIYGWRGASVSNILAFGHDFVRARGGDAGTATYALTVNRRSDARILELANRLAAPLYAAHPQAHELRPRPDAPPGEVRTIVHETYDEELGWLADQVQRTHAAMAEPAWREIGVLVRDNAHAADVFDALSRAEIPVEIVGLSGLLRLPEVSEVVSTLALLHDLTANADLLNLLTGPRWAIGPRDLALLGRRARELAGDTGRGDREADLHAALQTAVAGADPTEVVALSDALADPGDLPYSASARERFALLARELRALRTHTGESLLDLVRRIIDTCGIDVELDASVSPAARARRENLDLFVKAVAEFQSLDGVVTLPALLAYLTAEDELGNGLDVATPSEADSVKLLTVHRAKGLEWDAVFVAGVCRERFPSTKGRSRWPKGHAVLPTPLRGDAADLPSLHGWTNRDVDTLNAESRDHDAVEELRLGYVAFTRARHTLWVSSHVWRPNRQKPVGPSPFQDVVREQLATWDEPPVAWLDPPDGEPNPLLDGRRAVPWPVLEQTAEALRRLEAAELVREAATAADQDAADDPADDLDLVESSLVAEWDAELDRLLAEAAADAADVVDVPLPASLSATALARLRDDRDAFARDLARPMPRPPSAAARFGTRFHAWVEARFGQQELMDPDELPGRADAGIDDEDDLQELVRLFEKGPFAERVPEAVEPPFALVLAGQVVRGRIDAVYREQVDGHDGYLLVDWKTNRRENADPLQLAIYRVAWSELTGTPLERVRAAFYYVRTQALVEPDGLDDRTALERLLRGEPGPAS